MKEYIVKLNPAYPIIFARGGIDRAGEIVKERSPRAEKALVVTDTNVRGHYGERVSASLSAEGIQPFVHVIPAGEKSKTPESYFALIGMLANCGFKRTDVVVALGGGVVGDLAGFAAATYMRGINIVQAPTSLLAMIDSSIGGKTGVDLPQGKNLLGAFWQPKAVVVDELTLETLPEYEWKNGIGEGIKYACLSGGRILEILKGNLKENIGEFTELCAKYKADIVVADEREGGKRKLLNFGHTVGHAIEKASDFRIPHGVAVANGIEIMVRAAKEHGDIGGADYDGILSLLDKYGMRLSCEKLKISDDFALDKKAEGNDGISVILYKGIGRCVIEKMTINEFKRYINV